MTSSSYLNSYYFDKPVEYKGLVIWPVRVRDFFKFYTFAECLILEKNSIPDAKIISMSYLEYMYFATDEKNPYALMFRELLKLVCYPREILLEADNDSVKLQKLNNSIALNYDNKNKPYFEINGIRFNSSDFEEIKSIIVEQNLFEIPDETIQKEVRDKMQEAREMRQKQSGNEMGSLEDQMISLSIYSGWNFESIYDLTLRKFLKALERADQLLHYQIYLAASMSGMVEFKDKSFIKHWLTAIKRDNFDGMIKEKDVEDQLKKVNNAL